MSEYFFPERPQGLTVRHHQAESYLSSDCVFWWSMALPEELCPICSFPSPACLMAFDYTVIISENTLNKAIPLFIKKSTVTKTKKTIFTSVFSIQENQKLFKFHRYC